jgi:aldehyde:ferredoxin oxidoreductase
MGSKRLKAVIVKRGGAKLAPLADAAGLEASLKAATPGMKDKLKLFGEYGTPGSMTNADRLGNLAIDNWRGARAPEVVAKINGVVMAETIQVRRSGCQRCPITCARVIQVKDGPYATDGVIEAPEYETLGAFGTLQRVDNLAAIAKANELCNRLGMDSISVGGTIAFANECFEKGLITAADTDGLELGFGKPDANIELTRRIGLGAGAFARLLGHGSRHAAKAIGQGAGEFAIQVKGMEFPMHDPRFTWGHALGYATSARGACHLTTASHIYDTVVTFPEAGYPEPTPGRVLDGKALQVVHRQNLATVRDSLIACHFALFNNALKATQFVDWTHLITGGGLDFDGLMAVGARAFTLKRMINNRFGIGRADDDLPARMKTLRKVGENVDFDTPPIDALLDDYYQIRGWTADGRPTAETVARHGLQEFAQPFTVHENPAPAEESEEGGIAAAM